MHQEILFFIKTMFYLFAEYFFKVANNSMQSVERSKFTKNEIYLDSPCSIATIKNGKQQQPPYALDDILIFSCFLGPKKYLSLVTLNTSLVPEARCRDPVTLLLSTNILEPNP